MGVIERDTTNFGQQFRPNIETKVAEDKALKSSDDLQKGNSNSLPSERTRNEEWRQGWDNIVTRLKEWHRDPTELDDEGIDAPSPEILNFACKYAMWLRDIRDWPPPNRVIPNGDGGLAFQVKSGPCFQSLEFEKDGTIELLTFRNGTLVKRKQLRSDISQ